MTVTERNAIFNPATGLLIYQTNSTPGFYYYDGTLWKFLSAPPATTNSWNETGNAGTTSGNEFYWYY